MTTREIVSILRERGHNITFRARKDGGILITSLDGIKFSGARGNTFARTLYGDYLSKAREFQLQRVNLQKAKKRKAPLPEALKKRLTRVQRLWRKQHDISKGTIKTSSIRYILENEGMLSASEALDKAEKYALGLAYEENVMFLVDRMEKDELSESLISSVELLRNRFKESWINPIYQTLYEYEKNAIEQDEAERRIKAILFE